MPRVPRESRLNCPAAAGVATFFSEMFGFAAVLQSRPGHSGYERSFHCCKAKHLRKKCGQDCAQKQIFHSLFGPYFCELFSPFLPKKVLMLVTLVKTGFLINFCFSFCHGNFLVLHKDLEFSVGAFDRAQRKKDEATSMCIIQHPPVSAATSISVASMGATDHSLCKDCTGCVARRRKTLLAAVIQHCSVGL